MALKAQPAPAFADALGRPLTRGGLGHPTCWFSGGRVACSVAEHGGIETVSYWGRQPIGCNAFFQANFRSSYPRVFRAQVVVGERTYTLSIGDGRVYAGGFVGTMVIAEEDLELDICLVCTNRGLIQAVRPRRPTRVRFSLRLLLRDYVQVVAEGREWGGWAAASGGFATAVTDTPAPGAQEENSLTQAVLTYADADEPRTTWIGVVASGGCRMRAWRSQLRSFTSAEVDGGRDSDGAAVALIFHDHRRSLLSDLRRLQKEAAAEAWATVAEWDGHDRAAPTLQGLDPVVTSFVRQAPALLRATMPADIPGAMRASNGAYWIWGWDTLVHARAYLLSGHAGFLAQAIDLLARTAHPQHGIGHMFDPELRPRLTQALPAQGLLAIAVWQHYAVTGEVALARKHWPLLSELLRRTLALPRLDGLVAGPALFPDFPECAGHTGNDISVFNNGIHYQTCRSLEFLAGALGDGATAQLAVTAAKECASGFRKRLWDPRVGFWCDSIDSRTGQRRASYPAHALLWVSPFARELIEGVAGRAAAFMDAHHCIAGGLRMYPLWDAAFNADGNQLGQHYAPGQDPLYTRLMANTGNQQGLSRWLGWVRGNWSRLTVPEGCTLEAENDGPHRADNPGGRQMFTVKAWYDGLVGAIAGLDIDAGGLTAGPGLAQALTWSELPLHGGCWRVQISGSGRWLHSITVAEQIWRGTAKVPLPSASRAGVIVIKRSARPPKVPWLASADGAVIESSVVSRTGLRVTLRSTGRVLVRLSCVRAAHLRIDGKPRRPRWDAATSTVAVWLPGSEHSVAIEATLPD